MQFGFQSKTSMTVLGPRNIFGTDHENLDPYFGCFLPAPSGRLTAFDEVLYGPAGLRESCPGGAWPIGHR